MCKQLLNSYVHMNRSVQVQVRVPKQLVRTIEYWVTIGRFKSRSDAIKSILAFYEERERTREFYQMLVERSKGAEEQPELLVPLEE